MSEVTVQRINASGIGGGIIAKAKAVLSLGLGTVQARRLLHNINPCCIVGFGGYSSAPTMVAATISGLPTIIHEQNACLGRANRFLAGRVSISPLHSRKHRVLYVKHPKGGRYHNPVRSASPTSGPSRTHRSASRQKN